MVRAPLPNMVRSSHECNTDHNNLVYKTFNTERVMRWRLLIKEYGPELCYIKGKDNIVADVLSRYDMKEQEFSVDAFAFNYEVKAMDPIG